MARDVDEHIRHDWQCITYFVIQVVHGERELPNTQVRRWTNFRYDDYFFRA